MRLSICALILLSLQLSVVLAISRPSSDPDYSQAATYANNTKPPYARYDFTTVYVHAKDNVTLQEWTSTFYPRVDEFSQLTVIGTFLQNFTFNPNLTIWVEVKGFVPQAGPLVPKRVFSPDLNDLVIPYFTVIAVLDKGNVTDYGWDDGCGYCTTDECLDNQCGTHRPAGTTNSCTLTDCDLRVYMAWSGRDKNDTPCKSEASCPSNFRQISTSSVTDFGSNVYNDFIYKFTTNAPNPVTGQTAN